MTKEEVKEVVESPAEDITKEIEALKKEKEELVSQQEALAKQREEVNQLKEEIERLKHHFKEETVTPQVTDPIELIRNKFERLDYALTNFPSGHPERAPFSITDSYNGQNMLDGYYRYTKGEKIEEIFKSVLE